MRRIDPDHLPEAADTLDRFLADLRGGVDGPLPADGTEAQAPPHPPDALRAVPDVVATRASDGAWIVDDGPPGTARRQGRRHPGEAVGVARRGLHGPKGRQRGAMLDDGTAPRLGPEGAARIAVPLRPVARVAARGRVLKAAEGHVLKAEEISAGVPSKHAKEKRGGKAKGRRNEPPGVRPAPWA